MTMKPMETFANRAVYDLTFVDFTTQTPFLALDYANATANELTGETAYAYGGNGHPKRVSFSGERAGTLTIETQIQTPKLYALLTGATLGTSGIWLEREEVVATASNKLSIKRSPVTNSIFVYTLADDCGIPLSGTYASAAATAPDTGYVVTLTPSDGSAIAANTTYVIYYKVSGSNLVSVPITSTSFPKAFTVYGSTYDISESDNSVIKQKMIAYKCAPQSQMSVGYSTTGDPATLTITCDLMADNQERILDLLFLKDA